jgi:carboxymethylenebutenolidase
MTKSGKRGPVDQRLLDLYDQYAHGFIDRRAFVRRAGMLAVGGMSAAALVESVLPRYADAETISFTDPRIHAEYVDYPSPDGTSGKMRGYLVKLAKGDGPFPAVLVIHENRGLNPYIEDVARRAAVQGFLALAPDGLAPVGGYPGNDDEGREMQSKLDPKKLDADMIASAYYLKKLPNSTGKLGATGFCWGGGMVNRLAATLGADLNAGVPFYGTPPAEADIPKIKAHMMLQYAGLDTRITGMGPAYEAALKKAGVDVTAYVYDGVNHGFHNDSTPRYDEKAAKLAEERTWEFFKKNLA